MNTKVISVEKEENKDKERTEETLGIEVQESRMEEIKNERI